MLRFGIIKFLFSAVVILVISTARSEVITSFNELPAFVKKEVNDTRQACKEADDKKEGFWDEMQGIHTFYLSGDKSISILVDDRHICNGFYKPGNCHTWGCDVKIYRHMKYLRRSGPEWAKIFDEPISNLFLSVSTKNEFILAALSIVGKHDLCGQNYEIGWCDYLLTWKNDKWVWQRLR